MSRGILILAIGSLTRTLKIKPFGRNQQLHAMGQTGIVNTRLNHPQGGISENTRIFLMSNVFK